MVQKTTNEKLQAMTYIESKSGMKPLTDGYSETALHKKFAVEIENKKSVIAENDEFEREFEQTYKDVDWETLEQYTSLDAQKIAARRERLHAEQNTAKQEVERSLLYDNLLSEYGDAFAQLYRVKDNHEKYGYSDNISFKEVDITDNGDVLTQDQYYKMRAAPDGRLKQLALHVELDNFDENGEEVGGFGFNFGIMEFNQPNKEPQTKVQLSFDDETLETLDEEKLKRVVDFCEIHGISVMDLQIRRFDGSLAEDLISEKIGNILEKIKQDKEAKAKLADKRDKAQEEERERALNKQLQDIVTANKGSMPAGINKEDISYDAVPGSKELTAKEEFEENTSVENSMFQNQQASNSATSSQQQNTQLPQQNTPREQPKLKMSKVEESFEKMFEEDWVKTRKRSYFKEHTGWFGSGWTEYIFYDTEDEDHRKNDGKKQKDGSIKYTYNFKLFLKMENDGLHLTYRTPNNRKVDESMIGDIVGKLKSLGYTHINFPAGIPNAEKGIWQKAMAENGIVPMNMGLDSHKAGKMIENAKDKLSAEDLSKYKYRLALQMNRYNQEKGKRVSDSEQAFIDGLINAHDYAAFTDAYALVYKSKIKKILRESNPERGAADKTAAYRTLRKVFDAYKSALEHGGSLLNAEGLTPEEKRALRGPDYDLTGSASSLNTQQMDKLFDVLYLRQKEEAYNTIKEMLLKLDYSPNRGPKPAHRILIKAAFDEARESCEGINDDLKSLGIDEIQVVKVSNIPFDREMERYYNVDKPEYERLHPPATSQQSVPMPRVQPTMQAQQSQPIPRQLQEQDGQSVEQKSVKGTVKSRLLQQRREVLKNLTDLRERQNIAKTDNKETVQNSAEIVGESKNKMQPKQNSDVEAVLSEVKNALLQVETTSKNKRGNGI